MGHPYLIQPLLHSMLEQNSFLLALIHFPDKVKILRLTTHCPVCSDKQSPFEDNLFILQAQITSLEI